MKVYQLIAQKLAAINNCIESNNIEWFHKHNDLLDEIIKQHMPHGSGFDSGTKLSDESTGVNMYGYKQVEMSDHQFAKWLRDNGWRNNWHNVYNANMYHGKNNADIIAITICNNTNCTRKIFVKEVMP